MTLELSDAQYKIYVKAYGKAAHARASGVECWRAGMQAVLASVVAAKTPVDLGVGPHGEHVLDFVASVTK